MLADMASTNQYPSGNFTKTDSARPLKRGLNTFYTSKQCVFVVENKVGASITRRWIKLPLADAKRLGLLEEGSKITRRASRLEGKRLAKQSFIVKKRLAPKPKAQARGEPPISEAAFAPSSRAKAVLRGVEIAREDLRSSGGTYDLEQVRSLLHGESRESVDARVRGGSLLAVPGPRNERYYPVVQFKGNGEVIEGLSAVQEALPTKNGFAVLNFLIHPDERLDGRKPIDLLRAGEVGLAVEAARRYAELGA